MATLNATNLKHASSGSNNIVLAADGSTTISNLSGGGKILQVVSVTKKDVASNSTAANSWWSYTDNSLKVTLTPASASNKIYLIGYFNFFEASGQWVQFRFEQDGAQIDETVGDADGSRDRVTGQHMNGGDNNGGRFYMMGAQIDADSTSSRTYNLGFAHTSGSTKTLYLNRTGDDTNSGGYGRSICTLTAMEIAA